MDHFSWKVVCTQEEIISLKAFVVYSFTLLFYGSRFFIISLGVTHICFYLFRCKSFLEVMCNEGSLGPVILWHLNSLFHARIQFCGLCMRTDTFRAEAWRAHCHILLRLLYTWKQGLSDLVPTASIFVFFKLRVPHLWVDEFAWPEPLCLKSLQEECCLFEGDNYFLQTVLAMVLHCCELWCLLLCNGVHFKNEAVF